MGDSATLFKEKINFKLPGGAGFTAHQDAPAFSDFGPEYHITMMISVDPSHSGNGGLEFSRCLPAGELLPQRSDGSIDTSTANALDWSPLPKEAGDIVFFDSYIPHRSPMNHSSDCRRVLYITYNRMRDGQVRVSYYQQKRACFPPECERLPGVDYTASAGQFNVGNHIK